MCYHSGKRRSILGVQRWGQAARGGGIAISTQPPQSFGILLRRHRLAVGLTQEELAERARLSLAAINTLERGVRLAPRKETVALLAEALTLTASERAELEAAARRHGPALPPAPAPPAPAEAQPTSPEAPLPPAADPPQLSGPQIPGQFIRVLLPLLAKGRGRLAAGLIRGLLVVAVLAGALFLGGAPRSDPALHGGTLCLATEFPLTVSSTVDEWYTALGRPLKDAVQLAVQQNQNLGSGYTLKMLSYDESPEISAVTDQQDPRQGAQNMTDMVKQTCVVGVIGPLTSSVAAAEMPIAANAELVMISPANTNPGLTIRLDAPLYGLNFDQLHPAGKTPNYFRTVANDAFQGLEIADFTSRQPPDGLGARNAFVVEDHTPYGDMLAGRFSQEFLARGGAIVGTEGIPTGGAARIAELAARIVAAQPEVVLYGGTNMDGDGGLLKAQLDRAGYPGLLVSGDGIVGDPRFVERAGAAAANDVFAIVPVPDPATLTTGAAATFLHAFHAGYPDQDLHGDGYALYAYDAAMVLITAIKHLIGAGQEVTRAAVLEQVQHLQYTGVTGQIRFDANGDNAHGVFSIYTVQDGQWVYAWQVSV